MPQDETAEQSTAKFISNLVKARDSGYRITPLVGAGLSRPSGVPVTAELRRYLAFCVWRTLAHKLPVPCYFFLEAMAGEQREIDPKPLFAQSEQWNPRREPWLDLPELLAVVQKRLRKRRREYARLVPATSAQNHETIPHAFDPALCLHLLTEPGVENPMVRAGTPPEVFPLAQEAYGALADWRQALHFLSRIRIRDSHDAPILEEPDTSVIDSFFLRFISGREPCLGHRMLVAVADLFRVRVILTTNFDGLIEAAFQRAGRRLQRFDVPVGAALPSLRLVQDQARSIIKLHGGTHGLRADLTLDASPREDDRTRFLGYLAGSELGAEPSEDDKTLLDSVREDRVAVFVAGVSASDMRTRRLLEHVAAHANQLKIYWVLHNDRDVASLRPLELSLRQAARPGAPSIPGEHSGVEIIATRTVDIGLLFLEIYQSITGSIPASGIFFPAAWNSPLPPELPVPEREPPLRGYIKEGTGTPDGRFEGESDRINGKIESILPDPHVARFDEQRRLLATRSMLNVKSDDTTYGATTVCSKLFSANGWWPRFQTVGVWIEAEEILSPADFFMHLISAVARRAGVQEPVPDLDLETFGKIRVLTRQEAEAIAPPADQEFDRFVADVIGELEPLVRTQDVTWLVFVNMHTGAGRNPAVVIPSPEGMEEHPADQPRPHDENVGADGDMWHDAAAKQRFWRVLGQLTLATGIRLRFVILTNQWNGPHEREYPHLDTHFFEEACTWFDPHIVVRHTLPLADPNAAAKLQNGSIWLLRGHHDAPPGDPNGDGDEQLRGILLYLLILFEVPRYRTAVSAVWQAFQEAVKQGEFAEIVGVEPERVASWTHARVDAELAELERRMVLRRKAGGFFWIHASIWEQVRRDLRSWLDGHWGAHQRSFRLIALRLHGFIARWYGRLFLATVDPLAALEMVRHAYLGLRELVDAMRDQGEAGHVRRIELEAAIVILRHSSMVFSTAHGQLSRRVTERHAHALLSRLTVVWEELHETIGALPGRRSSRSAMVRQLQEAMRHIHSQLVSAHVTVLETSSRHDDTLREIHRLIGDPLAPQAEMRQRGKKNSILVGSARYDLRIRRAGARVNRRQYKPAREELEVVFQALCRKTSRQLRSDAGDAPHAAARAWLITFMERPPKGFENTAAAGRTLARALRGLFYLLIHQGQSIYLAWRYHRDNSPDREDGHSHRAAALRERAEILNEALFYAQFALELLRADPAESDIFTYYENSRLRSHVALALAILAGIRGHMGCKSLQPSELEHHSERLGWWQTLKSFRKEYGKADPDREREFNQAETVLSDARAYLEEFPLGSDTLSRGVLELRLAEVRLIRLATDPWFVRLRFLVRAEGLERKAGALLEPHDAWRLVGLLRDAFRAIDRADFYLRQHRKNAWWWQIHLTLRLKGCEYAVALECACTAGTSEKSKKMWPDLGHMLPRNTGDFISELVCLLPPRASADILLTARLAESAHHLHQDMRAGGRARQARAALIPDALRKAAQDLNQRLKALFEQDMAERDDSVADYVKYVLQKVGLRPPPSDPAGQRKQARRRSPKKVR